MPENWNSRFGTGVARRLHSMRGAKQGATGTVTVAGGANSSLVTVGASQTAATCVLPIDGLNIGDVIAGFALRGQVESAGGAVTVDAQIYKQTVAAADMSVAAITGTAMTQVSVSADSKLDDGTARKVIDEAARVTVAADATYFLLITVTTAASTDVALAGVVLDVSRKEEQG